MRPWALFFIKKIFFLNLKINIYYIYCEQQEIAFFQYKTS